MTYMKTGNKSIFLILFFVYTICFSQNTPGGINSDSWTLEQCIEYAFNNSPLIKSAVENLNMTTGQNKVIMSDYIPKINAGYSVLKNNNDTSGKTRSDDIAPSVYSDEVYTFFSSITDTVYSKKYTPSKNIVSLNSKLAESKLRQTKNDLYMNIKKTFYTVLFTEQTYKICTAAESVAFENYNVSQALYKEGKVSSFDVSRAKVRWISAKADVISARNSNILALESLKTVLSLPKEKNLSVSGELTFFLNEMKIDDIITEGLLYRPEIEQVNLTNEINQNSLNIAKAGYYPYVSASINYSLASGDAEPDFTDQYDSWSALLSVNVPVFDGKLTKGKCETAEAELKKNLYNKELAEDNIVMEIKQAHFSITNTKESIIVQKESVDIAKENLNIAKERYAMGLLSLLELKDVELSLIAAETQYIKTLYEYNEAYILLEHAIGLPYKFSDSHEYFR